MATRGIALGRIIDWARNADPEEVAFAVMRMTAIVRERGAKVERADQHHATKRSRRTKAQIEQEQKVKEMTATASGDQQQAMGL